jgi:hypothetical protein
MAIVLVRIRYGFEAALVLWVTGRLVAHYVLGFNIYG